MFATVFILSFFGSTLLVLGGLVSADHFRETLLENKRRRQHNAQLAKLHDRLRD